MTTEKALNETAKNHGYDSWEQLSLNYSKTKLIPIGVIKDAMMIYAQSAKAEAWDAACLAMRIECENKFQYQANQNKVHSTKFPINPYKS